MKKYFEKRKHEILPFVKDFHDPLDKIRFSNNIKGMKWSVWFFCHPSAYNLISFSISILGIIVFGFGFLYFLLRNNYFISIIFFFVMITQVIALHRKVRNYEMTKDLTFYDLWMREYL